MPSCSEALAVSHFFSTVSLLSWICAQMPQIYTNYKTKLAEGILPLFLLLWFMGDFLSFTSCLLNDVVLKFQVYLSLFFICNDITLCYQYYYYNSVYPRQHMQLAGIHAENETETSQGFSHVSSVHLATNTIHIRSHTDATETLNLSQSEGSELSSFGSVTNPPNPKTSKLAAAGLLAHASVANALAPSEDFVSTVSATISSAASAASAASTESLGLFLAWCCTAVYVSSRCPQLWKNYKRKSVDGISPLLFGSALVGNLTYTCSILTSCEFVSDPNKTQFFWRQLPYILGSSGTVVFDMAYFYQRYIYRNSGTESSVMGLQPWEDSEEREWA